MPDIRDFTPVTQETIQTIRTRLDADVNAGLDPADPRWTDTVEGGPYFDLTAIFALEMERLWDFLGTEVPAAMFPSYAWSEFLDEHALTYGLVRKPAIAATGTIRFTGTVGTPIPTGTAVGTSPSDPDASAIEYATTASGTIPGLGYIDLPAQAAEVGTASNVAVSQVVILLSAINGISAVQNVTAMASGEDQESDQDLQDRVLVEIASTVGAGTVSDYTRWSLAYPGVGNVTVQPLWAGAGTVRVVVTDTANQPVSNAIVVGLQAELDPVGSAGLGAGLAPIGAVVTVATPVPYYVNVQATVVHDTGYSLDGAGGTIATRASIVAAMTSYVNNLTPGSEVVLNRIEFAALSVPGVHDMTGTQLQGQANPLGSPSSGADRAMGATNLPVPSIGGSAAVARLQTVTLT